MSRADVAVDAVVVVAVVATAAGIDAALGFVGVVVAGKVIVSSCR